MSGQAEQMVSEPPQDQGTLLSGATVTNAQTGQTIRLQDAKVPDKITFAEQPVHPQPRKVPPVRHGYSQMQWMRQQDKLDRTRLRNDITMEEVAKHNTPEDGWIVVYGKVINIGPYLQYHPGGEDIMLPVLGKDATRQFQRYHPWVNVDMLVGKLIIGIVRHHIHQSNSQNDNVATSPSSQDDATSRSASPVNLQLIEGSEDGCVVDEQDFISPLPPS